MEYRELTDEWREQIALYALNSREEPCAAEMSSHLAAGCPVCQRELAAIQDILGMLPLSLPSVSAPPRLKDRLLARVQPAVAGCGPYLAHTQLDLSSLAWQPSGYPGVSFYDLRRDEATGARTTLVKIRPGSTYPDHYHPGGEDCLVLQGGFHDGRGEYRALGYVYYQPGAVQADFQALEGDECILLLVCPGGIELLSAK